MTNFVWMPVRYRNVIGILKNPFYAGVYVYGKSEKRTAIVDGRARRSYGHGKPVGTWEVMIRDHHEGYISWDEYERNQQQRWPSIIMAARVGLNRAVAAKHCYRVS
ncbi:hypothetical protein GGI59_006442 [Rhizobium lentis]|uniref:Recombinase domain-containing protein n=1 Tax=Rhizobium lentis TaxID=1138194 RepID=A0A7W9CYP5_9HYPH|nr:hypothetical protein [Rhizobium lentis]MBB5553224.1 hypothetical protein [Rhizobium lentis]MBB5564733.1 hypothetical protein [Rhizobium lentis]MBB5571313.1 hypothetical protein [Rhizobium lentis]